MDKLMQQKILNKKALRVMKDYVYLPKQNIDNTANLTCGFAARLNKLNLLVKFGLSNHPISNYEEY
jgi:hypothetical protein